MQMRVKLVDLPSSDTLVANIGRSVKFYEFPFTFMHQLKYPGLYVMNYDVNMKINKSTMH